MITIDRVSFPAAGEPGGSLLIPGWRLEKNNSVYLHGPSSAAIRAVLNMLAGWTVPSSGRMRMLGHDLGRMTPADRDAFRAQHMGLIFSEHNLLPGLSVMDNVLTPTRLSTSRARRCAGGARRIAIELLNSTSLPRPLWEHAASELSAAQQQDVAAARALIGNPALVLAENPAAVLPKDQEAAYLEMLQHKAHRAGSLLICTGTSAQPPLAFDEVWDLRDVLSGVARRAATVLPLPEPGSTQPALLGAA